MLGRTDFMVTVRGTNVYQSAVENILAEVPGVSMHYELVLTRDDDNDVMTIRFEPRGRRSAATRAVGRRRAEAGRASGSTGRCTCASKCQPVPSDSLPRFELKTKRMIDQRPKEFRRALDR